MTKESILHPVVPTTEEGGVFIGASIKGVPAGHLVTRMPSWMVPGDNLSSADLTGEEDTADTMPRVKGMMVHPSMVTVGAGDVAEEGVEGGGVAAGEDTTGGTRENEEERTVGNLLNQHRKAMMTETNNRNSLYMSTPGLF